MNHSIGLVRRNLKFVIVVIVFAGLAAARLLYLTPPELLEKVAGPPAAAILSRPQASPTPEPWAASAIAVAVREPEGAGIHLAPLDGGDHRRLVGGFDDVGQMAWSPDGAILAFAARRDSNWDLFTVAASGADLTRVTDHPAYDASPAWSPDGTELAFVSNRDGGVAVYRMPSAPNVTDSATLVVTGDGPLADPAWSPEGEIAFSAWHDDGYGIESAAPDGSARRTLVETESGEDLRAPAWRDDGRVLAYLRVRHGEGRLETRAILPNGGIERLPDVIAVQVKRYAWLPGGDALLVGAASRSRLAFDVRDGTARRHTVAAWASAANGRPVPEVAWSLAAPHEGLALASAAPAEPAPAAESAGLLYLNDLDVSGPRIHPGLAADYDELRREVAAGVGRDFLGTLSDMWRPLGFDSDRSAFFSWHKTGRAFDTQMEMRAPGGRRDMVLVREDVGGRTMWRMFLRAAAQDGSVGRPLEEPGWTFAAGSGDQALTSEGGKRGAGVPEGYWIDFTDLAGRQGWQRIPSLTGGQLNWRRHWAAIEYWHYERRDGLSWFAAASQVYSNDELASALNRDRLVELGISLSRLARLGFPPGWTRQG